MSGTFVVYCAGPNIRDLPGSHVQAVLVNIVDNYGSDSLMKETKRMRKAAKPNYYMIDSGGFSMLKAEEKCKEIIHDETKPIKYNGALNLTPSHVVDIIKKERPNDFIALDFPVQKLADPLQQKAEFNKKMEFNVPWTIETAELRQRFCPDVGLFSTLQCYDLEQAEEFFKAIDGIKFDGFSMPTRTLGLSEIGLFMTRIYQLGIRKVHLLGVTEFFTLSLAAYMARHFFDRVSLDSRTWKIRATFNTYINPHDLLGEEIGNHVIIDENVQMDCECPWCKDRTFAYIKYLPYYDRRIFLGCHNHWVIEKAGRELYHNSKSLVGLKQYLRLHCRRINEIEKLINILCLIEMFKDHDIRYLRDHLIKN